MGALSKRRVGEYVYKNRLSPKKACGCEEDD
jgi:hypothetical protein